MEMRPDCLSGLVASSRTFYRSYTSESPRSIAFDDMLIGRFMALDPHPSPEIIYWAADSKQLVIAQPDRVCLVR